jgi:hypothetical protein
VLELEDLEDGPVDLDVVSVLELVGGDHDAPPGIADVTVPPLENSLVLIILGLKGTSGQARSVPANARAPRGRLDRPPAPGRPSPAMDGRRGGRV